jgi:hypothetical protein
MTLIINKVLGNDVPHEIMGYHSWQSVTNMDDYRIRCEGEPEDVQTIGLEIEISKPTRFTQVQIDKMFEIFPYMQMETDSSVPGYSCEVITAPMSLQAWKEAPLKELLEYVQSIGGCAYSVTNTDDPNEPNGCGGHIHISKGQDWEKVVALMAMFIDQNKEIVQIICHRGFTYYAKNNLAPLNKSMKRYSLEYIQSYMRSYADEHRNSLNLQHSKTIEFRLPVGTLDYDLKMSHIEFLNNLYKCCDDVVHGRARIDRLTINKVCQDGDFLPKYMKELCISCSKKLVVLDKVIKARVDEFTVNKFKVVKALNDLQLALALANDATIRQGSINTINSHFTNITGATTIDDEVLYVKGLKGQNVISRGLDEYSDSHNNEITRCYAKLKKVLSEIEIPVIYEDLKGEK